MLEVFCDSSYNDQGRSYIGILALRDSAIVHQSTTMIRDAKDNLECEIAAIRFGQNVAGWLTSAEEDVVIYCDSTEAVKAFIDSKPFTVEFRARDDICQSMADRLSKKMPLEAPSTPGLCRQRVSSFTPEVLRDISLNKKPVLYLEKDPAGSTNTKTSYRLVIRDVDSVISGDKTYTARTGEKKNIKVAGDVSKDLSSPDFKERLEDAYFLITDETWGLRIKGDEAYSILPCEIRHTIICHEVDRSPENLFRRASSQK